MSLLTLHTKLTEEVRLLREREVAAIATAKGEGTSLPPNYWERRARAEAKLRVIAAALTAFSNALAEEEA